MAQYLLLFSGKEISCVNRNVEVIILSILTTLQWRSTTNEGPTKRVKLHSLFTPYTILPETKCQVKHLKQSEMILGYLGDNIYYPTLVPIEQVAPPQ